MNKLSHKSTALSEEIFPISPLLIGNRNTIPCTLLYLKSNLETTYINGCIQSLSLIATFVYSTQNMFFNFLDRSSSSLGIQNSKLIILGVLLLNRGHRHKVQQNLDNYLTVGDGQISED